MNPNYETLIKKAKAYATYWHDYTRCTYGDDKPYTVHLEHVVSIAEKYIHLVPGDERGYVLMACWCHDLMEDCRQTYNDIRSLTNEVVAEYVYALTNEKGRNRKERGNQKYYDGIVKTRCAAFVKICDRIANFQYSVENKSRMAEMYQKENAEFIGHFYMFPMYKPMFDELSSLAKQADELFQKV